MEVASMELLLAGLAAAALAALAAFALTRRRARRAPRPGRIRDDSANLLAAFEDPLLVVRERRVLIANQAARALLGAHIEGSDVRLAIRHPAAAEHLAGDDGGGAPVADRAGRAGRARPALGDARSRRCPTAAGWSASIDQSQARAAEQMRVDFVANASHELRTPLATLIGFIETLQDEAAVDPATRQRFVGDHGRRGAADARPARRSDVAVADRGGALRPAARHGRPEAADRRGPGRAEAARRGARHPRREPAPARPWSAATAASSRRCSTIWSSTRSNMAAPGRRSGSGSTMPGRT